MHSLGIDIGTTGLCGIAVDCESGAIVKKIGLENDTFISSPLPYERIQDSEKLTEKIRFIADSLIDENTACIGFSNQMHGIIYTGKNAQALSPLYTWQDARGSLLYNDSQSYAQYLGAYSGYGLVTDFYNRVNSLVPEGTKYLMSIGDYAVMKLCSLPKPLMHTSNAAGLGLFDYDNMRFKIDNGILPDVTDDYMIAGTYKNIPVTVSLGDNQASFLGSVRDEKSALVNYGTGSQLSVVTDMKDLPECFEARPLGNKKKIAAGCALCGGRAFKMTERFIAQCAGIASGQVPDSLYRQIDALLADKKDTSMRADTRFCGTRNDPEIKGAFFDIDENNFTPADMLLAALEGMARELYDMYTQLDGKCESLVCSGNGIRKNPALQRIVSEMFRMPLLFPAFEEEAAYGAALSAMTGAGIYGSIESAAKLIKYENE